MDAVLSPAMSFDTSIGMTEHKDNVAQLSIRILADCDHRIAPVDA